jgi:hypothetical protein
MKRLVKKILIVLGIVFIAIQFIQPAHNKSGQVLPTDFGNIYTVPANVQPILQNACYDCHSNNTRYPLYSYIQPAGWILANHIKKGKAMLNLSDFGSYSFRRRISKLKDMVAEIEDGEMPLASYKMLHKNARLSAAEKDLIVNWIRKTADSLNAIDN